MWPRKRTEQNGKSSLLNAEFKILIRVGVAGWGEGSSGGKETYVKF